MKYQLLLAVALFLCGLCKSHPTGSTTPQDPAKDALRARCILHNADWVAVASISTQEDIKNYPFVSPKSVSDGPASNSKGIPYLYMTPMDVTAKDLEAKSDVTVMATLAQTGSCKIKNYDTQDPRCSKIFITGTYVKLESTAPDYQFAQESLFARHPPMRHWPKNHGFYVSKINPTKIQLLDGFGGVKQISVKDYLEANVTVCDL